jgi:hypothetical protein
MIPHCEKKSAAGLRVTAYAFADKPFIRPAVLTGRCQGNQIELEFTGYFPFLVDAKLIHGLPDIEGLSFVEL